MPVRFEQVPKEKLKLRPQIRNHSPEYLRRLADSLLQAQLQPGGCLKDYTVIFGNGRVLAALGEPRITHLWMAILDEPITEREFFRRQAVENFMHNDPSNAEKCRIAVNYAKSEPSMTLKDIAKDLGVDPSMVTRWMAWEKCCDLVQQALSCDSITLQTMYSLSQLPLDQQEAGLANYLKPAKEKVKRNGPSVSRFKCVLLDCAVSFAYQGGGAQIGDIINTLSELLKQAKKANDEGLDAKTWERVLKDRARA